MTRFVKSRAKQLVDLPSLTAFGHLAGQVQTQWTTSWKTKHQFKPRNSPPAECCSKNK